MHSMCLSHVTLTRSIFRVKKTDSPDETRTFKKGLGSNEIRPSRAKFTSEEGGQMSAEEGPGTGKVHPLGNDEKTKDAAEERARGR